MNTFKKLKKANIKQIATVLSRIGAEALDKRDLNAANECFRLINNACASNSDVILKEIALFIDKWNK